MGHKISSIHIRPVKDSAERHFDNEHRSKLDYIDSSRINLNQSWRKEDISLIEYEKNLRSLVKEKTGRAMQKKATPVREGVLNLKDSTTLDDLHSLSSAINERFGLTTLQIHIHEDEGFTDPETKVWSANRHAHMVFDWTDHKSGKSIKLNQKDMREMQDIVAESLDMDRGKLIEYEKEETKGGRKIVAKGTRRHLDSQEYKRYQDKQRTLKAEQLIKYNEGFAKRLLGDIDSKSTIDAVSSLISANNSHIEELTSDHQSEMKAMKEKVDSQKNEVSDLGFKINNLESQITTLEKAKDDAYSKGRKDMSNNWKSLVKKSGFVLDKTNPKQVTIRPLSEEEIKKGKGFSK